MPERRSVVAVAAAVVLAGCIVAPSPTPSPSPSASPTPSATAPSPSGSQASVVPTATPPPPLSLPFPVQRDARQVRIRVDPNVDANDGEIEVTVVNLSGRRIRELVLRWPSELDQTLFLAPFRPSEQRIAEFGPPLHQEWTKWVLGPGENGEPAGTTSLGWGPLLEGGTLTIPILVTRVAPGEVAFDLQVLAGESILAQPNGARAEVRVTVPAG